MHRYACAGVLIGALGSACAPSEPAPSLSVAAAADAPDEGSAIALVAPRTAERRIVRAIVGGDLLPHRPSLVAPASIRAALAPLAPVFAKADVVVANYEAATGEIDERAFRMAYAAPPGWLEELPRAGVQALTVANNHACDLGLTGLSATLAAADRAGVVAIGGDEGDPWAPRTIAEDSGKRVCAVGWTTLMNAETACARSAHLASAPLDRKGRARITAALARAKQACDATIAIVHGGREYVAQTPEVMDQARHAADAGADAVVIHHPHVASPVVVHATRDGRKVPIFASVGNLVSNQGESWLPTMFPVLRENRRLVCVNGWTRLGVLADLAFELEGEGAPRLTWGFHLTWTENEHATDRAAPVPKIETRLLEPAGDAALVARLREDERGPVALFDDPCWAEGRDAQDAARRARCTVSLAPAPGKAAFAKRPRRADAKRKK